VDHALIIITIEYSFPKTVIEQLCNMIHILPRL